MNHIDDRISELKKSQIVNFIVGGVSLLPVYWIIFVALFFIFWLHTWWIALLALALLVAIGFRMTIKGLGMNGALFHCPLKAGMALPSPQIVLSPRQQVRLISSTKLFCSQPRNYSKASVRSALLMPFRLSTKSEWNPY